MKVEVFCPTCSKKGYIDVSDELLKDMSRGLLAVNVNQNICSHSFIAYIDKNSHVRDYFKADFHIELPQTLSSQEIEINKILGTRQLDVALIKMNLLPTLIVYIIKAIFFKQRILLISNLPYLHKHIINFFQFITQNSFNADISIITKENYTANKKNYDKLLIFEDNKIINDKGNVINPKELKVEEKIVQKFMEEDNSNIGLIVLKNEIQKVYELSKTIVDIIKNTQEKDLNIELIIDNLKKNYNVKISTIYLDFLFKIVEKYYKIDIPKSLKRVLSLLLKVSLF